MTLVECGASFCYEDCQPSMYNNAWLKDDTASVSDGMEDDNDVDDGNPHELVSDVIDLSHEMISLMKKKMRLC